MSQCIKMLVLDLDGTILNDKKKIIPENLKAIQELKKNNPQMVLCIATGRTFQVTIRFAKELEADVLITDDGGAIYTKVDDKKYKLEKAFYISEQECAAIFNKITKYSKENPDFVWHFSTDNIDHNSIIGSGEETLIKAYKIFCPHEKVSNDGVLQIKNFEQLKKLDLSSHIVKICTYFGKGEIGKKQHHEFNEYLEKGKLNALTPFPTMKVLAPLGVDKGTAIIDVMEKLKEKKIYIKRSEVAIVGNDNNDFDMLCLKGCRCYCPSNATKQIKDLDNVSLLKGTNNEPWMNELIENITSKIPLNEYLAKAKENFSNYSQNDVKSISENINSKSTKNHSSFYIAK